MYYRSKNYYIFLFTLVNEKDKLNRKHNFFFIRKSLKEIDELSEDNHSKSLIALDQYVYIVKDNDSVGPNEVVLQNYIQRALFSELIQLQKEKQDHHIHLTTETLYDMKSKFDFFPFIYQERRSLASHHLLVLDINTMEICSRNCINSNLQIRKYLRKSEAGYGQYTLTRTSDIFE